MKRIYNIQNLKHFTTENASYYGRIGGQKAGKTKLKNKMNKIKYNLYFIRQDLEPYLKRKRIYNKEYEYIKNAIHNYKILNNRLNKLIDKYNKKYGVIA